jgi:hypothetical protein
MGTDRRNDSQGDQVQVEGRHLRQLRRVSKLFARLPRDCSSGSGTDKRMLSYASYAGLVLLGTLNPAIDSLRDIQRASELRRVRKALTPKRNQPAPRTSMGSLSESVRVFDPALLLPIIGELSRRLPKSFSPEHQLPHEVPLDLLQKVVAVDGSCLSGLSEIIRQASYSGGQSAWRMHMQFRPLTGLPDPRHPAVLTRDRTCADDDERAVLRKHLEPNCVYVGDRGYEKYDLFNAIVEGGSDYVVRVQKRSVRVVEKLAISAEATAAGVIEDTIVSAGRSHPSDVSIRHPVRRVTIQLPAHAQGKRRTDSKSSPATKDKLVLLTSLIDVPAEVLGAVYRLRWMIETFFRFFKHVLGLRRLFSHKPQGVQIQIAVAIIAALLMALASGRSIGRTGTFALQMYVQGLAEEDEVIALLARDARERTSHD